MFKLKTLHVFIFVHPFYRLLLFYTLLHFIFRRLWSMGTTASAAQQPAPIVPPSDSIQGNGSGSSSGEDRNSLSIHSFQTVGIHNKAKSIITNKVAPVVIT